MSLSHQKIKLIIFFVLLAAAIFLLLFIGIGNAQNDLIYVDSASQSKSGSLGIKSPTGSFDLAVLGQSSVDQGLLSTGNIISDGKLRGGKSGNQQTAINVITNIGGDVTTTSSIHIQGLQGPAGDLCATSGGVLVTCPS